MVVKDPSIMKSRMPYDPEPMEIIQKKRSMITAENGWRRVTRNSSFFKPVKADVSRKRGEESDLEGTTHETAGGDAENPLRKDFAALCEKLDSDQGTKTSVYT